MRREETCTTQDFFEIDYERVTVKFVNLPDFCLGHANDYPPLWDDTTHDLGRYNVPIRQVMPENGATGHFKIDRSGHDATWMYTLWGKRVAFIIQYASGKVFEKVLMTTADLNLFIYDSGSYSYFLEDELLAVCTDLPVQSGIFEFDFATI